MAGHPRTSGGPTPLLPSGPGGVHGSPTTRTRPPPGAAHYGAKMAERVGFEPTVRCRTLAFQASTFVHSVISPKFYGRDGGIRTHKTVRPGLLRPPRIPIPPHPRKSGPGGSRTHVRSIFQFTSYVACPYLTPRAGCPCSFSGVRFNASVEPSPHKSRRLLSLTRGPGSLKTHSERFGYALNEHRGSLGPRTLITRRLPRERS